MHHIYRELIRARAAEPAGVRANRQHTWAVDPTRPYVRGTGGSRRWRWWRPTAVTAG